MQPLAAPIPSHAAARVRRMPLRSAQLPARRMHAAPPLEVAHDLVQAPVGLAACCSRRAECNACVCRATHLLGLLVLAHQQDDVVSLDRVALAQLAPLVQESVHLLGHILLPPRLPLWLQVLQDERPETERGPGWRVRALAANTERKSRRCSDCRRPAVAQPERCIRLDLQQAARAGRLQPGS